MVGTAHPLDAMGKSDWDEVIKHSDEAIRLEADIADAYWVRGTAHLKKKDYANAIADCTPGHQAGWGAARPLPRASAGLSG